ncbi:hypothetical protein ACLKA7_003850 [Drosophila subpalustris]
MEPNNDDTPREAAVEINNNATEPHVTNQSLNLNGNSKAEAVALQAKTQAAPKRGHDEEMSLNPGTSKKLKSCAPNLNNPVKLGFISPDRTCPFTSEQMAMLKAAILKTTLTCFTDGVRPQFDGCGAQSDWYVLVCSNYNAAEWVRRNINHIKANCTFDIELLEKNQFPTIYLMRGYFPNSLEFSNETILGYISAQNDVCTMQWKVVRRINLREIVHLEILIDKASFQALQKNGLKIWYCFGHMRLTLMGKPEFRMEESLSSSAPSNLSQCQKPQDTSRQIPEVVSIFSQNNPSAGGISNGTSKKQPRKRKKNKNKEVTPNPESGNKAL